jgi:hypothetical protein
MRELTNASELQKKNQKGRGHAGNKRRCDGNIKTDIKGNNIYGCGLDSSGSGYGPVAASFEHAVTFYVS